MRPSTSGQRLTLTITGLGVGNLYSWKTTLETGCGNGNTIMDCQHKPSKVYHEWDGNTRKNQHGHQKSSQLKGNPSSKPSFFGSMLVFRGVTLKTNTVGKNILAEDIPAIRKLLATILPEKIWRFHSNESLGTKAKNKAMSSSCISNPYTSHTSFSTYHISRLSFPSTSISQNPGSSNLPPMHIPITPPT